MKMTRIEEIRRDFVDSMPATWPEGYRAALIEVLASHDKLVAALRLTADRLQICEDRMRGCHAETGNHELLDEIEDFAREAKAALVELTEEQEP